MKLCYKNLIWDAQTLQGPSCSKNWSLTSGETFLECSLLSNQLAQVWKLLTRRHNGIPEQVTEEKRPCCKTGASSSCRIYSSSYYGKTYHSRAGIADERRTCNRHGKPFKISIREIKVIIIMLPSSWTLNWVYNITKCVVHE